MKRRNRKILFIEFELKLVINVMNDSMLIQLLLYNNS